MLGLVVCGSRTWMWTTAAPALAASMADWAIWAGVTGTAGFLPGVSAEPVTAHAIITLRCMVPPAGVCPPSLAHVPTRWTTVLPPGHAPMWIQDGDRPAGADAIAVSAAAARQKAHGPPMPSPDTVFDEPRGRFAQGWTRPATALSGMIFRGQTRLATWGGLR